MSAPRIDDASREERLYDDYLELAIHGDAPDPDEFLSSHGGASEDLRIRLRELRRAGANGTKPDDGALPFERLGEYRLIRRIGRGGMGLVFLAEQSALEREVALKILRPELAASNLAAERFKREARAIAKLRHPGIVAVFGFGEEGGVRYLAMEYIAGRTLEEELERAPVPLARKVRWIRDLARALDYAHGEGVIHRDVKPSNVRITPDDRALLVDFGLVRATGSDAGATLTESFAGSPSYASPEQISSSARVDARTDVYSLGVTLYRCATGLAPFEGDSVEQVFQRILNADPTPPRKIDPTIPRDLQVVILKAMERSPERRYATAGELADDLDAVLELRPVRARPPTLIERGLRLAKRRKVASASALTGALALLASAGYSFYQARNARDLQRKQAASVVAEARERVQTYRDSRAKFAAVQSEVEQLRYRLVYNYLPDEDFDRLDAKESQVDVLARGWETTFYEVLDLLRYAERLDPQVEGAETVRAELYREKYREALITMSEEEIELYRGLVEQHDEAGDVAAEVRDTCTVSLASDPPGAGVYLFRYVEHSKLVPGGEARQVPVPYGDTTAPAEPGTWTLRVLADAGELREHDYLLEIAGRPIEGTVFVARAAPPLAFLDRIVSVDGYPFADAWAIDNLGPEQLPGTDGRRPVRTFVFDHGGERIELRARSLEQLGVIAATPTDLAARADRPPIECVTVRDGERFAAMLAPRTRTRTTGSALYVSPRCRVGTTPIEQLSLPRGDYAAVLRLPGYEDQRVTFRSEPGHVKCSVHLDPLGTTPRGFVRTRADILTGRAQWIMEREVSSDEYLEFLNDPRTVAAIRSSGAAILFPRESYSAPDSPLWKRCDDGTWEYDSDWRGDFPVVGVSWADAVAYARWMSERALERGERIEYVLPTLDEFVFAGTGGLRRSYSWGTRYRPKWARTCFSRPHANIGPVLQFPLDESPLGAYDFCGGAGEWIVDWYDEGRNLRHLCGGAWGQPLTDTSKVGGGNGVYDGTTTGETGFRLFARELGP